MIISCVNFEDNNDIPQRSADLAQNVKSAANTYYFSPNSCRSTRSLLI